MFSYLHRGKDFYREVFALALPMIFQSLVTDSLGLLDTFMVGLLGEAPMAAVTLANIPIFVIYLMTFGLQSGESILIAQFYGKGDTDSVNRVMGIALYLAGGLTFAFGCILFFAPVPFMSLFGNDSGVIAQAARYGKIVSFSFLFDSLAQVYIAAHRSMGRPKLGSWILSGAGVVNAILNYLLIFGKLGLPAMGIAGAALATALSRLLELVCVLFHALAGRTFPLRPALLLRPGRDMLHRYIRYGTPVLLNETLYGLGNSLYTTIMGHMPLSQAILAAYGISGNINQVCTVIVFAMSGAASIIVGREIGAGRRETVYDVGRALDTVAFLAGAVTGGAFLVVTYRFFVPVVYPIFSLSPQAREIATLMSVVTFSTLALRSFNSTNVVGVLRGGGDVKMTSLIDLGPLWLVALPCAALSGLVFQWDILAVCLSMALENVVKFFLGLWRLHSGKWIRDVTEE